MSPPPAVFKALIEAIPAEEDAAFIAQAGEHGRMTSRAGSVQMGSSALTVAAIDKLNATIFPPDQLQALEQTGLAQFDFEVPGVEGTFTALAGSGPDDRWLDIRRKRIAAPAGVISAAAPIAAPPAPGGPFGQPDLTSDQPDFSGLDFPARGGSDPFALAVPNDLFEPAGGGPDPFALTVPDDIFDRPGGAEPESPYGEWRQTGTPQAAAPDNARVRLVLSPGRPPRSFVRVALAAGGCLAVALLGAAYFGAIPLPFAGPAAASQPSPAARTSPPPAQASVPPATQAVPPTTQASVAPPVQANVPPATQASVAPPAQASVPPPTQASVPPPTQASVPPTTQVSAPPAAPVGAPPAAQVTAPPAQSPAPKQSGSTAAVTPAPAAQAARPEGPSRSGFSVQVAAVKTRDEADRMVTRFVSQGSPAYFVRGEGAAASYYRVRIGPFPDRGSAEKAAKQLEGSEGVKPWIVKETPENKTAASQPSPREESSHR
jgi:cell division septation protein DedD